MMFPEIQFLLSVQQPTSRVCFSHRLQSIQYDHPKLVAPRVHSFRSGRFLMTRRSPATNSPQKSLRTSLLIKASSDQEAAHFEDVSVGEKIPLDTSVFEEVHPSPRNVVKPVGSRVRGMPIPQSTLIPDDWKDVQQYLHRSKKERKQETLVRQLEWAKRRALEKRLTRQELDNERWRGQETAVATVVSVEKKLASQLDDPEIGVGTSSNVIYGRARPKDFRLKLQQGSDEENAESLCREEEAGPSRQVEADSLSKNESEDVEVLASNGKQRSLTAEEREMLKNKTLNFTSVSSNKWTPIHTLAASGQVYLAAKLLKRAVNLEVADGDGLTPMHRAVQAGRKTMVRMLLNAGANALALDKEGATLLHYSAQNGNHDISKLLIRHGVDVNAADVDGWTPLHLAVQSGSLELVKALVYRGAHVNKANKDGNTPLGLALALGGCLNFYEAIKFLKKMSVLDSESRSVSDEDDPV